VTAPWQDNLDVAFRAMQPEDRCFVTDAWFKCTRGRDGKHARHYCSAVKALLGDSATSIVVAGQPATSDWSAACSRPSMARLQRTFTASQAPTNGHRATAEGGSQSAGSRSALLRLEPAETATSANGASRSLA
jgi:hypothetical protein